MPTAHRTRIGPLDCIVVDGGQSPSIPVIICHGYGASYEDLAPLSGEWIALLGESAAEFKFVFPDAPHSLEAVGMPDARAWWPINMAELAEAVQASRFDELHDQIPPGIDASREMLCETIQNICDGFQGASTPLVMGGFSQGAMLTMETALRGSIQSPVLLFQFSGTVVCKTQWKANLNRLQDTVVFQSHGKIDPILPYSSAVTMNEMLCDAKVQVDFHSFMGPHTIDVDSVQRTAVALSSLLSE